MFSSGVLQVQRKVLAGGLEPEGHISLFLLHRGKRGELGLGDEGQKPGGEPVGVSEKV